MTLVRRDGPDREAGFDLLAQVREAIAQEPFRKVMVSIVDIHIAQEKARLGDLDGAIDLARTVGDDLSTSGGSLSSALATTVLVEALLHRGSEGDLEHAQAAIDRLIAERTDPGFLPNELALLRLHALLAKAHGDEAAYRDYRDRYRAMVTSLGFEGRMKWAEAMP